MIREATLPRRSFAPAAAAASVIATLVVAAAAAAVALEGVSHGRELAWPLAATAALIGAGVAMSLTRERDILSPSILVAGVFALYYVARPLYILQTGRIGPTRALDDRALSPALHEYMAQASWLAVIALAGFLAGTLLAPAAREWIPVRTATRPGSAPVPALTPRLALLLGVGIVLVAAVYGQLVLEAGGIGAYVESLSTRSEVFFGRAYLTLATLPLKCAVFLVLWRGLGRARWERGDVVLVAVSTAVVLVGDFLTGGRAVLLIGSALPLMVLFHHRSRRLRGRDILLLGAAMLTFFVGSRVLVRDSAYSHDAAPRSAMLVSALTNIEDSVVGGRDAIPYDSLVRIVEGTAAGDAPTWGRTYLAIATYPVPRALWPAKPLGGGNAWFTTRYFPQFYFPDHIETSVSLVGESYAAWRVPGVVVLSMLLGLAMAGSYRSARMRPSSVSFLLFAVTLGYALTLLRGDAFHSVTSSAMAVVVVLGELWFVTDARAQTTLSPRTWAEHVV